MAPAKKTKASAGRKVKDKWKAKEWYKIHAPRMFNEAEIGETPSADPEYVIGRTAEDFVRFRIRIHFYTAILHQAENDLPYSTSCSVFRFQRQSTNRSSVIF